MKRRPFVKKMIGGGIVMSPLLGLQDLHSLFAQENLSCQQYTWFTFFRRENKEWVENLDHSFASFRSAGFNMFEPTFENVAEVNAIRELVAEHEILVKSFYVNSVLHDPAQVTESTDLVLSIGEAARKLGAEIIVTNPSPIQWGGPENKSDKQLIHQAQALEKLGKELKSIGLTLAYHNHDAEMREGAREFHHMLSTDPEYVSLCLDAHWIYRGSGNSSVALFDIIDLYRDRIVELHLRQSRRGIWTETFGAGDIDYSRLAEDLTKHQMKPLVVMEQAVEEGTPHRLHSIEAMSASRINATYTFRDLLN